MRWSHPDEVRWLLLVPMIVAAWVLYVHAKTRARRRVAPAPLASVSRLSRWRHDLVTLGTALLATVALVAALMGPQRLAERRTPEYARLDLIVVLDRSASMRATDVGPSRFARALAELRALILDKPEAVDRVALVGFSGTAVVLSYLTRDVDSLLFYLEWLGDETELYYGTDLGTALIAAHQVAAADRQRSRKVVLVISDGDDQGDRLPAALARLNGDRIPVYAVGIGSDRPMRIPVVSASGPPRYLEDEEGQPLVARFGETTLREIAAATGGRYVRSTTGVELARAIRALARAERRVVGWKRTEQPVDLSRVALAVAALALAGLVVRL